MKCRACALERSVQEFFISKNPFAGEAICKECAEAICAQYQYSWSIIDKYCQYLDIPFVPKELERLRSINPENYLEVYINLFYEEEYNALEWGEYNEAFKKLEEASLIENEIPLVKQENFEKLRRKWGQYPEPDLLRLESLYEGLVATQNVTTLTQQDQALKYCRISLQIDKAIESGEKFDTLMNAYEKVVRMAEFVPKASKSASDFETVGELFRWLEKRGWVNEYYDGVTRDVADATLANIQNFSRKLYTDESGVGEEITRRINNLRYADDNDAVYDLLSGRSEEDFEEYDDETYKELTLEDEDFTAEV